MSGRRSRNVLPVCMAATVTAVAVLLLGAPAGATRDAVVRTPAATQGVAARVDRHGFPRTLSFWKCADGRSLSRYDMFVGFSYCPIGDVRRGNPSGVFMLTPGLFPRGDNYGGMSVTYGDGLWHWQQGDAWKNAGCDNLPGGTNLGCMRPFSVEYDPLRNANGTAALIENGTSGHPGWNLSDPLGKGTRELVAWFFAYTAKVSGLYANGWDGVFSDNWIYGVIGKSWAYGPTLDTDRDWKVDNYGVLRKRWDDGLNEVGNRIRSYLPGKIVGGNGNWYAMKYGYNGAEPNGWLKASNLTMVENVDEHFYDHSKDAVRIASRWLGFRDPAGLPRYLLFQQDARTNSGDKLHVPAKVDPNQGRYMLDPGVMRSMRWGLTLGLVAGAYYEIIADGHHETRWWYDEYDGGKGVRRRGYLGQAVTPAIRLERGGVWRRDFQRGIALNNSTPEPVEIRLARAYRHLRGTQNPKLNDGRLVTTVTLAGHDGVVLLNAKQPKKNK
jgi:Hypothetical glycosyl hydrolase family 15